MPPAYKTIFEITKPQQRIKARLMVSDDKVSGILPHTGTHTDGI